MTHTIRIDISDLEHKAWSVFIADPQEWIETLVRHEIERAMNRIYQQEVERLTADPTVDSIPANIETVVAGADLTSAKERDAVLLENLAAGVLPGQIRTPAN